MKVAVMSAKGLGDGLLSMVFSYNFSKSGHLVTTFSTPLTQMRRWFEGSRIHPHPSPDKIETLLNNFDLIVSQDHSCLSEYAKDPLWREKLVVADACLLDKSRSLVDNFAHLCKEHFALPYGEKKNGMTPPAHLTYRAHPTRVVLHPFSTSPKREWPLDNFVALAERLKKRGFAPAFTATPQERDSLLQKHPGVEELYQCPQFDSLDEMASYLYESSYFVGNNSGPGHLASNFGLPTLSLFARKSYAKLWRPSFSEAEVVTPLPFVFGARQKEKSLQTLLPVTRVLRRFLKMKS